MSFFYCHMPYIVLFPLAGVPSFRIFRSPTRTSDLFSSVVSNTTESLIEVATPSSGSNMDVEMADNPFKHLVISACGHFGHITHGDLKNRIEHLGATYSAKVTPECTHLITTKPKVQKNGYKIKAAYDAYFCEIVSLNWFLESEKAGNPLPEENYRITIGKDGNKDIPPADGQVTGMKRVLEERSGVDDEGRNKRVRTDVGPECKKVIIPPHPACPFKDGFMLYVDLFGLVYDARLVQSTAGGKKNQYYHQQLLVNKPETQFISWACWGRIGQAPHTLDTPPFECAYQAKQDFEARFHAKTGIFWSLRFEASQQEGKYRYLGPTYESWNYNFSPYDIKNRMEMRYELLPPECSLSEPVKKVIAMIFNKNRLVSETASMGYDTRKVPLGQLRKQTLAEGYEVLQKLSELINSPDSAWAVYHTSPEAAMTKFSSEYLTIIPHAFGKNQPPVISTAKHIKKELELLDELANATLATSIINSTEPNCLHPLDRAFQALDLQEMTPLEHNSGEFQELERYFALTAYSNHHKVKDIFRIQRTGEDNRFKSSAYATIQNRRLLWHGSRTTNYVSILGQGLRVSPPGVKYSGSSLGDGIYFADTSSKSLNFCSTRQGQESGLLLLCDVELGHAVNVADTTGHRGKMVGTISTQFGKVHDNWIDASHIHPCLTGTKLPVVTKGRKSTYSKAEYVVYDASQIRIRYLVFAERG